MSQQDVEGQGLLDPKANTTTSAARKPYLQQWSLVVQIVALATCCTILGLISWNLGRHMNALKQALPSGRSAQGFQQFPTLVWACMHILVADCGFCLMAHFLTFLLMLQADASRFPCSGNGIQSQGDLSCRCYDCWTVSSKNVAEALPKLIPKPHRSLPGYDRKMACLWRRETTAPRRRTFTLALWMLSLEAHYCLVGGHPQAAQIL